jgi:hypothetical protein
MDIKTIAFILLIGRIISVAYIFLVLRQQWKLLRTSITPKLQPLRQRLFFLALVIFIGNLVPITIDLATLLTPLTRGNPSPLGITYAFSNCITAALSSFLLWELYRMAARLAAEER